MLRSQQAKSQLIFAKKEFAGRVILYTVDSCAEKKCGAHLCLFHNFIKPKCHNDYELSNSQMPSFETKKCCMWRAAELNFYFQL